MFAPASMILVSLPAEITPSDGPIGATTYTTDRGDAEVAKTDLPMADCNPVPADIAENVHAGEEIEGRSRKIRYDGCID